MPVSYTVPRASLSLLGVLGLVWCSACSDYALGPNDDDALGDTDGDDGTDTHGWPQIDGEDCNGIDDDGDGQVDEGFPDTDGDGVADCLDSSCAVRRVEASQVGVDTACEGPVLLDNAASIQVEWSWSGPGDAPNIDNLVHAPVVAHVTDDDGDGVFGGAGDVPDVVLLAYGGRKDEATLFVLDGASGQQLWSKAGFHAGGGLAVADVKGDGRPEIVAFDSTLHATALSHAGVVLWTSNLETPTAWPLITVADLDNDGLPEVLADNLILAGLSGVVVTTLDIDPSLRFRMPTIADLDGDGEQEIVLADTVWNKAGELQWKMSLKGLYGHWSAIADADLDGQPEVITVAGGQLAVYDSQGHELTNVPVGQGRPGPPCVGDFDGDGEPEVAWADTSTLHMYDLDGQEVWSAEVSDASGLAGCSGWDIDGDGALELIYADEHKVGIYDGPTGAARWVDTGHQSETLWEYPVVADVDADGSAELLVSSNGAESNGWSGLTVLGHVDNAWPRSGPVWPIHDYAVTNIDADGHVPGAPRPWAVHNTYRARPAEDNDPVDLHAAILDACLSGCRDGDTGEVAVQVSNRGASDSRANIPVALYSVFGSEHNLIDVKVLDAPVPAGWATDTIVFDITPALLGPDGLLVRVDDDGQGRGVQLECDETDNEGRWDDNLCY